MENHSRLKKYAHAYIITHCFYILHKHLLISRQNKILYYLEAKLKEYIFPETD